MLFLNNDDVKQVLTMELTMNALDQTYRELARQQAVCRPRIDGRRLDVRLLRDPHEI